ncbi:hypothetical protein BOTBODRAFT_28316 [Botryobasidium botryosum FD-172 SS1]|uniref:Dystroglycan-type cadherin-like domain-containing protein n=1 Tax=Botryobasidium botryosum (strain FD-172 SS1) TaxID=930990 RepID=A0A067MSY8_BOTB1|nr:hypothetical protein BOTBODRAFT_28316 [Botryobasidium botryosum FD-172 SS1]
MATLKRKNPPLSLALLLWALSNPTHTYATVLLRPFSKQLSRIARVGQPYSWSFEPAVLVLDDAQVGNGQGLAYRAENMPSWMSLDPTLRTFTGTPEPSDEGSVAIKIFAFIPGSNSTSDFTHQTFHLLVSSAPPPELAIPLVAQINANNTSITGIPLSPNSFLGPSSGAVRVQPKDSFSIGFLWETFRVQDSQDIFFAARLKNGSDLPEWIKFDNRTVTFDGFAPEESTTEVPTALDITLFGSDSPGHSAGVSDSFRLVVASHDYSLAAPLSILNTTSDVPFHSALGKHLEEHILIDGKPLHQVSNGSSAIDADTKHIPWMSFDSATKTLRGRPPTGVVQESVVAVQIIPAGDSFNPTLHANVSIHVVPSYFNSTTLPPLLVHPGSQISFSLLPFLSNHTLPGERFALSALLNPHAATSWLAFTPSPPALVGTVPPHTVGPETLNVTFTARSLLTSADSRTSLIIAFSQPPEFVNPVGGPHGSHALSKSGKIAIAVSLAVFGGLILLCCILAGCRRYCAARDREVDEEPREYIIEQDKEERASYYKDKSHFSAMSTAQLARPTNGPPNSPSPKRIPKAQFFRAVLSRSASRLFPSSSQQRPRPVISNPRPVENMKTADSGHSFFGMITPAGTTRDGSDNVENGSVATASSAEGSLSSTGSHEGRRPPRPSLPQGGSSDFEGAVTEGESDPATFAWLRGHAPDSESSLSSVPRKRNDFIPPSALRMPPKSKSAPLAHRRGGSESGSEAEEEGVVTTAARVEMVKPARSIASIRGAAEVEPVSQAPNSRPRLVPFLSEQRSPVTSPVIDRSVSHKVLLGRNAPSAPEEHRLTVGLSYLGPFGDDDETQFFYSSPEIPAAAVVPSSSTGSSSSSGSKKKIQYTYAPSHVSISAKSSLERDTSKTSTSPTSTNSGGSGSGFGHRLSDFSGMHKVVVGRSFSIPMPFDAPLKSSGFTLSAGLADGTELPSWLRFRCETGEFWGTPTSADVGPVIIRVWSVRLREIHVLGQFSIEVVKASARRG